MLRKTMKRLSSVNAPLFVSMPFVRIYLEMMESLGNG